MQSVISVRFIESRGQLISLSKDKVNCYFIAIGHFRNVKKSGASLISQSLVGSLTIPQARGFAFLYHKTQITIKKKNKTVTQKQMNVVRKPKKKH